MNVFASRLLRQAATTAVIGFISYRSIQLVNRLRQYVTSKIIDNPRLKPPSRLYYCCHVLYLKTLEWTLWSATQTPLIYHIHLSYHFSTCILGLHLRHLFNTNQTRPMSFLRAFQLGIIHQLIHQLCMLAFPLIFNRSFIITQYKRRSKYIMESISTECETLLRTAMLQYNRPMLNYGDTDEISAILPIIWSFCNAESSPPNQVDRHYFGGKSRETLLQDLTVMSNASFSQSLDASYGRNWLLRLFGVHIRIRIHDFFSILHDISKRKAWKKRSKKFMFELAYDMLNNALLSSVSINILYLVVMFGIAKDNGSYETHFMSLLFMWSKFPSYAMNTLNELMRNEYDYILGPKTFYHGKLFNRYDESMETLLLSHCKNNETYKNISDATIKQAYKDLFKLKTFRWQAVDKVRACRTGQAWDSQGRKRICYVAGGGTVVRMDPWPQDKYNQQQYKEFTTEYQKLFGSRRFLTEQLGHPFRTRALMHEGHEGLTFSQHKDIITRSGRDHVIHNENHLEHVVNNIWRDCPNHVQECFQFKGTKRYRSKDVKRDKIDNKNIIQLMMGINDI